MDELKKILTKYGYKMNFESVHVSSDVKKYTPLKDAINEKKFITIKSPSGHVVGRLHDVKESAKRLKKEHFKKLADIVSMFEIPNSQELASELKDKA